MSEYTKEETPAYMVADNSYSVYADGKIICGAIMQEYFADRLIAHLTAQANEITRLQEANATLLQGMEAQSEKLGEARGFIREIADMEYQVHIPSKPPILIAEDKSLRPIVEKAQAMLAAWEAETASESEAVE